MGRVVFFYLGYTTVRLVTVEVGRTHAVFPTLEYSMPMSSPAAPGLTSPRALRSRVLQASSASEDDDRVLSSSFGIHYSDLEFFECLE